MNKSSSVIYNTILVVGYVYFLVFAVHKLSAVVSFKICIWTLALVEEHDYRQIGEKSEELGFANKPMNAFQHRLPSLSTDTASNLHRFFVVL